MNLFLELDSQDYVVIIGAFTSSCLAIIAAVIGGILTVKGLQQVKLSQLGIAVTTSTVAATTDKIATKTDEIHALTNSSYTDQKEAIIKLQETVAVLNANALAESQAREAAAIEERKATALTVAAAVNAAAVNAASLAAPAIPTEQLSAIKNDTAAIKADTNAIREGSH